MPSDDFPIGVSAFRNVFGHSAPRNEWFDWGTGHASALAINPKFLALGLEGGTGGQILVGRLDDIGKHGQLNTTRLHDHKGQVTDLKWNLFNDNVLASCSIDCTVKVWHVNDDTKSSCVRSLNRHSRRVDQVEWHTTVDNVLLSAGSDSKICLWNIESDSLIFEVSDFLASYITFSPNSSLFAATSRQLQRVCIFDARTGYAKKSSNLPHNGGMLPKVIFVNNHRLITFGNSKINRRQMAYYNLSSFGSVVTTVDIDGASGQLLPIFDPDLRIIYVTGKGDSTIRYYEVLERSPWVVYLSEYQQPSPHSILASISKRALNFTTSEIMRIYRLHSHSLIVQPISFIMPKRDGLFHQELYPPTKGPTPAVSLAEWIAGLDCSPVQLHLRPGQPRTTCKPVLLKEWLGNPKLVTSDANNDKKFRFLSQVTKPDYRALDEREDCDEIMKTVEVMQKLQPNSLKTSDESASKYQGTDLDKTIVNLKISDILPIKPPHCFFVYTELNVVLSRENQLNAVTSEAELIIPSRADTLLCTANIVDNSLEKKRSSRTKLDSIQSENVHSTDLSRFKMSSATISLEKDVSGNALLVTPVSQAGLLHISSSPCLRSDKSLSSLTDLQMSTFRPQLSRCPGDSRVFPRLSPSAYVQSTNQSVFSRQRCVDEPIDTEINPFKQYFQAREGSTKPSQSLVEKEYQNLDAERSYDMNSIESCVQNVLHSASTSCSSEACTSSNSHLEVLNGNSKEDSCSTNTTKCDEGHRLLENTVTMLELQLRRTDSKIIQLERLCDIQKKDIESLRFEIKWKDERIEYLQKTLSDLESASQLDEDS